MTSVDKQQRRVALSLKNSLLEGLSDDDEEKESDVLIDAAAAEIGSDSDLDVELATAGESASKEEDPVRACDYYIFRSDRCLSCPPSL